MGGPGRTTPKGELFKKVIRADGTVEDLGLVASTEDGSIQVGQKVGSVLRDAANKLKERLK